MVERNFWRRLNFSDLQVVDAPEEDSSWLNGGVVHISSTLDDAPLVFKDDVGDWDGVSVRIMNVLAERLNFTYTMIDYAEDDQWGSKENGTWNGMLGEVDRGEKDMTINYFTITEDRPFDFDYSVSYYNEGFGFALSNPPPLPEWRNIFYPFHYGSWILVIGVVFLFSFILHWSGYMSDHYQNRRQDQKVERTSASAVALVFRPVVLQNVVRVPTAVFMRCLVASWWLTAFFLTCAYTSNLVAVLTVPKFPAPLKTLKELSDSQYKVCMVDYGEFVEASLKKSDDAVLYKLGQKMELVPETEEEYMGQELCTEKVTNTTHSHIETYSYLISIYHAFGLSKSIYLLKESVYEGYLAFFYRKKSALKKAFDPTIVQLVESGIIKKWYKEIMREAARKFPEMRREATALSLTNLQGQFFILFFGFVLSTFVFIFEITLSPKNKKLKIPNKAETEEYDDLITNYQTFLVFQ